MGIGPDGYYSLREILGYNAQYNIVLSDRGRGKTYGTKKFLMEQDGQFMCLYRTEPDMYAALGSWLDTLYEIGYSPEEFEWEKGKKGVMNLLYHGMIKGYFRCLTHVNHIKQEKFPDTLNWIWLDEFIPLVYKKLGGVESEGDAIRAIVKTVDHDTTHTRESKGLKPVRVLMYANPFTWNNPILSYFKVRPRVGIYRVGPGIVCEYLEPYEKPKGGKQTIDDFLGDEVNKNQGWMDETAFVLDSWPKGVVPKLSIRLNDMYFGMYAREGSNRWYCKRLDGHIKGLTVESMGSTRYRVYGTMNGLREDEICLEGTTLGQSLLSMAYKGTIWYKDMNTKFDFLNNL